MGQQKKYEMLPEEATTLFRIRALRDIPEHQVFKDQLGGLIEREENLCQEGLGWVSYSSMVTGNAKVVNAHLEKKSHATEGALVLNGNLTSTLVRGNSKIRGTGVIQHSDISDSELRGQLDIHCSTLDNVCVRNGAKVHNSHLSSYYRFEIKEKIVMERVNIDVGYGEINRFVTWEHVGMKTNLLKIDESISLKYVKVEDSKLFLITSGEFPPLYKSEMIGKDRERPVHIKGASIRLKDSRIQGEVVIDGDVDVIQTSIEDMVHIRMKGTLEHCRFSEMATIQLPTQRSQTLSHVTLESDEVIER